MLRSTRVPVAEQGRILSELGVRRDVPSLHPQGSLRKARGTRHETTSADVPPAVRSVSKGPRTTACQVGTKGPKRDLRASENTWIPFTCCVNGQSGFFATDCCWISPLPDKREAVCHPYPPPLSIQHLPVVYLPLLHGCEGLIGREIYGKSLV
jgi:hypothetical protein